MTRRHLLAAFACLILAVFVSRSAADQQPTTAPNSNRGEDKPEVNTAADLQRRLEMNMPDLNWDGTKLSDVCDVLRHVSGVNIVVDWAGLKTIGIHQDTKLRCKLRNMSLKMTLKVIMDAIQPYEVLPDQIRGPKAVFAVQENIVVISTNVCLNNQRPPRPAAKSPQNDSVEKILDQPVTCALQETTLSAALKKLMPDDGVLDVDWAALKSDGVSPDTSIDELKVAHACRREVLSLLLLGASANESALDFAVAGGKIHISTQEKLDKSQ